MYLYLSLFQRKERSTEQAEESLASKDPGAQYNEVEHVSSDVTYTLVILALFLQIITSLTSLLSGTVDCSPKQRLLRNMGAHVVVLDLLQVPYGKRDKRMTTIISHAHRFLQHFCQGDEQNQMILYRNMNSLLQSGNHVSLHLHKACLLRTDCLSHARDLLHNI